MSIRTIAGVASNSVYGLATSPMTRLHVTMVAVMGYTVGARASTLEMDEQPGEIIDTIRSQIVAPDGSLRESAGGEPPEWLPEWVMEPIILPGAGSNAVEKLVVAGVLDPMLWVLDLTAGIGFWVAETTSPVVAQVSSHGLGLALIAYTTIVVTRHVGRLHTDGVLR